jgi:hypothetical protein
MLLEPKNLSFLQQYGIKGIYQETTRFLNIGYEKKRLYMRNKEDNWKIIEVENISF